MWNKPIISMLYLGKRGINNMRSGCTQRGSEIYEHLMSFNMNQKAEIEK